MRDEAFLEKVRENVRRQSENPDELIERLIRAGIIDNQGRVLVRMPEPPPHARKKKKKPGSSANGKDKK